MINRYFINQPFRLLGLILLIYSCWGCQNTEKDQPTNLAEIISQEESFPYTKKLALEILSTGFSAGDGYREVWIRDYNTFIEAAALVYPKEELKENLLIFFGMQGTDGNIMDGFTPKELIKDDQQSNFHFFELEPNYAGHKNTVETDQETSLIQAVYKYVKATEDHSILNQQVGDKTVLERMEWAMDFLMEHRLSEKHGLIWGATTADWGDVQPEHGWGVYIDSNTHKAIDIYDNAMLIIALDNLMELAPATQQKWQPIRQQIARQARALLWDDAKKKFIPHLYLEDSPFPEDFDENEIYYFGGTAIAIEAGLLSQEEVLLSAKEMVARVKKAGAASIGLTLYPPYPAGFFENKIMNPEYNYQNGGDWTWFGGRMIQQLIQYGFLELAYEQLLPMTKRVQKNEGFFEWYSKENEPRGSGTFRGSAGVLYVAITQLEEALSTKK